MPPRTTFAIVVLSLCGALAVAAGAVRVAAEDAIGAKRWAELQPLQYRPKMTPDTVTDYRPQLARRIAGLPSPSLPTLPALVRLLKRFKVQSRKTPGGWIEGRVYLGANPREYRPSDVELLAAEIGNRIHRLIAKASLAETVRILELGGLRLIEITYNSFEFRHADVMGSGRYYYSSPPKPVRISLKRD